MHPLKMPRPQPGDYNPLFQFEIDLVPDTDDFGATLREQNDATRLLAAQFGDKHSGLRYGDDKWTVRGVLGHLIDCERIISYRALRIAREDVTPLPGFDGNAYVPAGRFDDRRLFDLVEEFAAVRGATIALFEGLPADCWSRRGQVGKNVATVAALAYLIAGHERHHQNILRTRYLPLVPGHSGT